MYPDRLRFLASAPGNLWLDGYTPVVSEAVDVFAYLDFRALLRDFYVRQKAGRRGFSYRAFARRAGLASPNHLKRVMDGERNLTTRSVAQYCKAMGLEGESAQYFAALVAFNQASTHEEREAAYERLLSFRGYRRTQHIDARYAEYHSHWFIPVVREMAQRADFRLNPRWIAAHTRPAIKVSEAARALEVLRDLQMLEVDPDGVIRQTAPVVSTGKETANIHVAKYHREMLELAADAMTTMSADERYLSGLTFCVQPDGFRRIQERVQRFRNELIAILAEEEGGQEVLHLGIQLFPVSGAES